MMVTLLLISSHLKMEVFLLSINYSTKGCGHSLPGARLVTCSRSVRTWRRLFSTEEVKVPHLLPFSAKPTVVLMGKPQQLIRWRGTQR